MLFIWFTSCPQGFKYQHPTFTKAARAGMPRPRWVGDAGLQPCGSPQGDGTCNLAASLVRLAGVCAQGRHLGRLRLISGPGPRLDQEPSAHLAPPELPAWSELAQGSLLISQTPGFPRGGGLQTQAGGRGCGSAPSELRCPGLRDQAQAPEDVPQSPVSPARPVQPLTPHCSSWPQGPGVPGSSTGHIHACTRVHV